MTRTECRESLRVKDTDKVCLLLGWDLKRKGLDIVMKAVNKCRESDPNIILGVIGAGRGKPADYAETFIRRETEFSPNEPWIRYFNDYEDMFAVHRAIDVYISASRKEAFSYGLLGSISQDTPIVVSDVPGTKWSAEYSNSYFYPVEDYKACAEAIMKALKTGRVKTNSAEMIEEYGIDQWCDKVLEVYSTVMKKSV